MAPLTKIKRRRSRRRTDAERLGTNERGLERVEAAAKASQRRPGQRVIIDA